MLKKIYLIVVFSAVGHLAFSNMPSQSCIEPESEQNTSAMQDTPLQIILTRSHKATMELKTCELDIQYLFIEDPDLIDSRKLQTGKLYYSTENDRSHLRISFDTVQHDDFEPVKQREEYLFDGVWLTTIDFKLKQVNMYQKAPVDKPMDVFELIQHNFPLVGFSNVESLSQDFVVSLVSGNIEDPNTPVQLLLKTRDESKFKDEYTKIDFWIDNSNYLPARIKAYHTQGDIYDIRFFSLKINKKLENTVFTIETPEDFRKNIEPLKTEPVKKGN